MNTPEIVWAESQDGNFVYDCAGEVADANDLRAGDVVYFGERFDFDVTRWVCAEDVIDNLSERAYEEAGEHAEDYPTVGDEARAELDALLAGWVAKHCPPTFYGVRNVKPYTLTTDDAEPGDPEDRTNG